MLLDVIIRNICLNKDFNLCSFENMAVLLTVKVLGPDSEKKKSVSINLFTTVIPQVLA